MPGLWKNQEGTREGKYLVQRRDGTVPPWPWFVLGASDPAAVAALNAYAAKADELGYDAEYVNDVRALAMDYERWRLDNGQGDADAPRHRTDDPEIVAKMRLGNGA